MSSPRPLSILARSCGIAWLLAWGVAHGEVSFEGLEADLEANARALMPLAGAACDASRRRVERLYRDAGESLHRALQAKGYYHAEFAATLDWEDHCWRAHFSVRPGEPVRYRAFEVQVEGPASDKAGVQVALSETRPVRGDILDHGRYEAYKNKLLNAVIQAGYFDARFESSEVLVDPAGREAQAVLVLDSGGLYRFDRVSFTGGILRDSLLQGFTDIRPGQDYDPAAIDDLYQSLADSGYFKSVSISTEPRDPDELTVPVQVLLEPAARRIWSVGAGFATDTGPQGKASFTNRRVNLSGHQLESRVFGSPVRAEWSATYRWPRSDPRREWFSLSAGILSEDTDTSEKDSGKVGLLFTKGRARRWQESRYVDFLNEDFTIGDQRDTSRLVILGVNWENVSGRELRRTQNGYRFGFDVRGSATTLGSDTHFVQVRTGFKWIRSFSPATRLLARARLGYTWHDRLEDLPVSFRFLAGGDQSVRGYDLETIGARDAEGRVIGGNRLVEASFEIERLVRPSWAISAFVDSGSAHIGSDFDPGTGVGIGVRWFSPVGPVRLDLAHPLDDPDRSWRIHVTLGPDL